MAEKVVGIKKVAIEVGKPAKWVRAQVAAGVVTPRRAGRRKDGRYLFTSTDVSTLRAAAAHADSPDARVGGDLPVVPGDGDTEGAALAVIERLEADRANLLAQVAWERAIAQEQQKALEIERVRANALTAELETQRTRIEQLKALSALDRVLGRHKAI